MTSKRPLDSDLQGSRTPQSIGRSRARKCASIVASLALLLTRCTGDDGATDAVTLAETARSASSASEASAAATDAGAASPPVESMDKPSGSSMDATRTTFEDLPAECRGFDVKGLKYSPGGSILPNKCAPFDGLRNNPYAIRCIDADPDYRSDFPGDEYCILPPQREHGTQVHITPSTTEEIETFVLGPGADVRRSSGRRQSVSAWPALA